MRSNNPQKLRLIDDIRFDRGTIRNRSVMPKPRYENQVQMRTVISERVKPASTNMIASKANLIMTNPNVQKIYSSFRPKHLKRLALGFCILLLISTSLFIYMPQDTEAVNQGFGKLYYGESASSTPKTRDWDNSAFGSENAAATAATTVRHTTIKASPTRDEMIGAISTTTGGVLYVQRWNGSSWSAEWNATVGDSVLPRFDVAYEQSSGDAIVVYSGNVGTTNELRYRKWDGSNWTSEQNLNPARTSGTVDAIKLKSRSGTNNIGLAWGDTAADLSADFWDGDTDAWKGEHSAALSTNLSRIGAGTTLTSWSFDLAFETSSGELVVGWGTEGASDPSFMKRTAGAAGAWSGTTVAGTAAVEEVTDFEMVSDPNSNYIGWINMTSESTASAGSPDLEAGMWDGSSDTMTIRFNGDTACGTMAAGTKNVSAGWLSSGGQYRFVYAFDDATAAAVNWGTYDKNGNTWNAETDHTTAPVPATEHIMERITMNPFDQSQFIYIVADASSDLFTKKLSFNGSTYTWTGIEPSGSSPETSLSSVAGMVADFAYNLTMTELNQTGYRWYANSNSTDVGSTLAALNTGATAPAEGTPFRLRMLLKVQQAGIKISELSLKLQYAERGADNSCDTSFTNETYEDVSGSSGEISFYNNSTPTDGSNMTSNANDPTNGGDTVVDQTYEESNNFTNSTSALALNENGNWDFTLVDNNSSGGTVYCFRAVKSDGSLLGSYTQIPQITTAQPTVDAISPSQGIYSGGTPFTITGTKFAPGATVTIGGTSATNVFVVDRQTVTGITGSGTIGARNVVVTNPSSSSGTYSGGFTYKYENYLDLTKTVTSDFSSGTLTNLLNAGIKMSENEFQWLNSQASTTGGSMSAGTYYYVVTATDFLGNETAKSVETLGVTTTGSSSSISLSWRPVQGATGYKLYRTTSSGTYSTPSLIATISSTLASTVNSGVVYVDTASAASSGAPPGSNSTNGELQFTPGSVPSSGNGTFSAGPAAPGNIRWGGHALKRPDGRFLIIRGGSTTTTYIYNPVDNNFSTGPALTGIASQGSHSIERPDGKFLIYSAVNTAVTSIYDPVTNIMTAGPTVPTNIGSGSNSVPRGDGTFLTLAGGGTSNTVIYNPVANSFTAGPAVVGTSVNAAGYGSFSYVRPDGKIFFALCTGSSSTGIYDPGANTFSAGPALGITCDAGTHGIQRPNGTLLVVVGASSSTTTNVYNPYTNTMSAGPTLPATAYDGSMSLQRPDGKYLVILGNGTTTNTAIYDPVANTMSSGPSASVNTFEGGHAFQLDDGRYFIVSGDLTTQTQFYNAGWYAGNAGDGATLGTWESENLNASNLTTWDKLSWVKTEDGGIQATNSNRTFTTIADGGISTGQFSDTAIGTNDLPIISYWDQTNGDLIVYSCSNNACTSGSSVSISDPGGDSWGQDTSIAIGSDGYPVISHYNSTDGDIAITKCGNASCSSNSTTKFINSQVAGDLTTSIAIGADDLPIVAYSQFDGGTDSDPVISQCTTTSCTALTTTVLNDGTDNSGHYGTIVIGSDDLPVFAYRNTTETGLAVAKCTNASCTSYGIVLAYDDPSGFQNGYDTSMVISPDGYPIISHYITSTQDLMVTKCTTHTCTQASNTTTLISDPMVYGEFTSMALGTDNLPIISSWRNESGTTNDALIITHCLNDSCSSSKAPIEYKRSRVAEYTSLVIGSDGYPFISWWDYNNGSTNDLAVLKCVDISCSASSDDTAGQVEVKTATTSGGLSSATYRKISNGDSIGAGTGEIWLKIKVTFKREVPNWSSYGTASDNSGGGSNVWICERTYGRTFEVPTIQSITASYTIPSVPTEQFMRGGNWFSENGVEQGYNWAL